MRDLRRLDDSREEEVGFEAGSEMLVAQAQYKKNTYVRDQKSSTQGQFVD